MFGYVEPLKFLEACIKHVQRWASREGGIGCRLETESETAK